MNVLIFCGKRSFFQMFGEKAFEEHAVRKPRMTCFPDGIITKPVQKKLKRNVEGEQILEAFGKAVAPRDVCQSDVRYVLFQLPDLTVTYNWFRSSNTVADLWIWLEAMEQGAYTHEKYTLMDQDLIRQREGVPLSLEMTLGDVIADGKRKKTAKSDIRLSLRLCPISKN